MMQPAQSQANSTPSFGGGLGMPDPALLRRHVTARALRAVRSSSSVLRLRAGLASKSSRPDETLIDDLEYLETPFQSKFYELFNYREFVGGVPRKIHDMFRLDSAERDTQELWNKLDMLNLIGQAKRDRIAEYFAFTPGTAVSIDRFILEPETKRLWHQAATWNRVVRGVPPICDLIPFNDSLLKVSNEGVHPLWEPFIILVLNRMLVTSAGLQGNAHDSVRGTIAIQVIREMIMWRYIIRYPVRVAGPASVATIPPFGTFRATVDDRISIDGIENGHVKDLNPCNWKTAEDIANGLLAWTTVKVDSVTDPKTLLQTTDYSINGVGQWCMSCLQFSEGRDLATTDAFVGLLRFMFVWQWLSLNDRDDRAAMLCANEFLHRAVAVPELEACLPELLGVGDMYRTGHDIDTGAVTLMEAAEECASACEPQEIPKGLTAQGVAPSRLPRARRSLVVMSVLTRPLSGKEWQVSRVVPTHVKYQLSGERYCLSVSGGKVECHREGICAWVKRNVRKCTGVQAMGVGGTREASVANEPEASGPMAISNALAGEYGEEACLLMLAWLHRGSVQLSKNCTAASFVPESSLCGDMVVNQTLEYSICRKMVFGRRGHELYWLPGEGLSCFRVRDSPSGVYILSEIAALPDGVEACAADISMGFG